MKNIIYILLSLNYQKTYIGITSDPGKRLVQHNNGCNNYTRRYRPWKIIYTEKHISELEARKREKYLKSSAGRKFIKKLLDKIQ